jgi:integrase
MRIARLGQRPLRVSTGILVEAPTKWQRDQQRADAESIYATRVSNLAKGRYDLQVERPSITFSKFAEWYTEHKLSQHRGQERDLEMLANLVKFFGRDDLTTITKARVEEYLTKRTGVDGKKPGTANREVDLLKSMLAAAVPDYLPNSPIAGMRRLRTVKIQKRVLEAAEEKRVLDAMDARDRALFIAGIDTLVRMGDLLDLRRQDDHRTLFAIVDSKTGPYQVPISTRLRKALDGLEPDPQGSDYYFWWRRRARTDRDRRSVVRKVLRVACKAADVPYGRVRAGITWHTGTRASGATRMLRDGADPATVQKIGHWATLEQMGDYLQTDQTLMRAAVELTGKAVARAARKRKAKPKSKRPARRPSKRSKGRK